MINSCWTAVRWLRCTSSLDMLNWSTANTSFPPSLTWLLSQGVLRVFDMELVSLESEGSLHIFPSTKSKCVQIGPVRLRGLFWMEPPISRTLVAKGPCPSCGYLSSNLKLQPCLTPQHISCTHTKLAWEGNDVGCGLRPSTWESGTINWRASKGGLWRWGKVWKGKVCEQQLRSLGLLSKSVFLQFIAQVLPGNGKSVSLNCWKDSYIRTIGAVSQSSE